MNHKEVNVLTIAAGFGERMGGEIPKGLVEVGGSTIIGRMFNELQNLPNLRDMAITTNDKFYPQYSQWLQQQGLDEQVKLLNNGVRVSENRLGAIGDIIFALDHFRWWEGAHLLVLPSDALYHFSLADFLSHAEGKQGLVTVVNKTEEKNIAGRLGCATLEKGQIVEFEEKPALPKSPYGIVPIYYYPEEIIPLFREYKESGGSLDAPSSIISWLLDRKIPVYAFETEKALDVGTPADIAVAESLLVLINGGQSFGVPAV